MTLAALLVLAYVLTGTAAALEEEHFGGFPFSKNKQCQACLLLADNLLREISVRQLPSGTEEERKKYLAKESRLLEIMETARVQASTAYTFIEGKYYKTSDVLKLPNFSKKVKDKIRLNMEMGHGTQHGAYIRFIMGEHEEKIEELVKQNIVDRVFMEIMCIEIVKVCRRGVSIEKMMAMDPEGGGGSKSENDL